MVTAALWTRPFPDGELFDICISIPTAAADLAAREPPGYLQEPAASALQFILYFLEKAVPPGGGNRLCQAAVLQHAFDVQVLADEYFAAVRDAAGQLVLEILPLVCGPALFLCNFLF